MVWAIPYNDNSMFRYLFSPALKDRLMACSKRSVAEHAEFRLTTGHCAQVLSNDR